MAISTSRKGFITCINKGRFFGFITTEAEEKLFWHGSALMSDIKELRVGDEVEFRSIETPKGPEAVAIKLIQGGNE